MKRFSTILFLVFAVLLVSCKKETIEEEKPGNPEHEKYYGTWRFTKTNENDSYQYVQGQFGSELVHIHDESIQWVQTGTVSKGEDYGTIRIKFDGNNGYTVIMNNSADGSLTCIEDCGNLNSQAHATGVTTHQLTETDFYVNLGWTGSNGTTSSSRINGVKL